MTIGSTRRGFLKLTLCGAAGSRLTTPAFAAAAGPTLADRLAVCSWSLQPSSARDLLGKLEGTGIRRLQIALDPVREDRDGGWSGLAELCARKGVAFVSGMFGAIGEDYSTLESIRRTGGVVPDATWPANWRNIRENAVLAQRLGVKLVTFHAGFLPHQPGDPGFATLQSRLRQIADLFAASGIALGLETGQETAETLASFLVRLDRPGVGVNFDPANMVLYAKGDPVAALNTLAPWVRQCHVKDARRTRVPGTWGEEVPLGTGDVDWKRLLPALAGLGFAGPLCIEREAGSSRVADVRAAREYLDAALAGPPGR
jgi:L-ribulose-5-phosphate 3-epimerase